MGLLGLIVATALNVWAFPSYLVEPNERMEGVFFVGRYCRGEAHSTVDAPMFAEHVDVVTADVEYAVKGHWNLTKTTWLWRHNGLGVVAERDSPISLGRMIPIGVHSLYSVSTTTSDELILNRPSFLMS